MEVFSLISIAAKFSLYIATFWGAGTVFYLIFFAIGEARASFNQWRLIIFFAAIGLLASLALYLITAARLTGELSAAFNLAMLSMLWSTPVGTALILRIVGFSLMLVCLFGRKLHNSIALVACLVLLGSFTQIGHVAAITNFLFQLLLLIHLIGIALWIGILLPLYRLSSNPAQIKTTAEIAHRFGRLAMLFVPILLIAGGGIAYKLLNSLSNLFSTAYGQMLIIKLATVSGLLALAAINKLRLVPALKAGNTGALKQLKNSVLAELVLVLLVLLITAVLTSVVNLPAG